MTHRTHSTVVEIGLAINALRDVGLDAHLSTDLGPTEIIVHVDRIVRANFMLQDDGDIVPCALDWIGTGEPIESGPLAEIAMRHVANGTIAAIGATVAEIRAELDRALGLDDDELAEELSDRADGIPAALAAGDEDLARARERLDAAGRPARVPMDDAVAPAPSSFVGLDDVGALEIAEIPRTIGDLNDDELDESAALAHPLISAGITAETPIADVANLVALVQGVGTVYRIVQSTPAPGCLYRVDVVSGPVPAVELADGLAWLDAMGLAATLVAHELLTEGIDESSIGSLRPGMDRMATELDEPTR